MKERPILFRPRLVRAILDGKKTQTRRVVNPQPMVTVHEPLPPTEIIEAALRSIIEAEDCPYGKPGDRLWVRESFSVPWKHGLKEGPLPCWYWADGNPDHGDWTRPKPSIHMPRWACRLLLEVVEIRVQRLRDMTEEEAQAEGAERGVCTHPDCEPGSCASSRYRTAFAMLWDTINADRGFGWGANPLVRVVTFKRVG